MFGSMKEYLTSQLEQIEKDGLFKRERIITSPQSAHIKVDSSGSDDILNMCANNYLGLANHPDMVGAARKGLEEWGYGLASVRFICGTQDIHKQLEQKISDYLQTEDTILYTSCFDANGGLFETILSDQDFIISDQLNHASIIDGIRLCKAQRLRYSNSNMEELEKCLIESQKSRFRLIATDGVFSMDGTIAKLDKICQLAEKHDAMVMVDDSHAVGIMGAKGRGTHEHHNVIDKVDIITGTLGKALGGAIGGYTSGRKEIIQFLRQKSRPYLFSNSVAPPVVVASIRGLEILMASDDLRIKLRENTLYFRKKMTQAGFNINPGEHPIVPIMLGDAVVAEKMAVALLEKGLYVIGFSYPVVPKGQARIRVQVSAAHSRKDINFAIEQFTQVKKELNL